MNVRRFSARSAREALGLVRQAFGDDAVVLSTRPAADGVEVLAMAGDVRLLDGGGHGGRRRAGYGRRRQPSRLHRLRCRIRRRRRAGRGQAVDEHAVVPGLRMNACCAGASR